MPPKVEKLLAELKAYCDEERGRRIRVARMLGVSRSSLSDWFNPDSPRLPTAEQALDILDFLKAEKRSKK